jgi:hypothetical protein
LPLPALFEALNCTKEGLSSEEAEKRSAHLEGVESEKIVGSGHSTQSHPETIEEVRRILREHIGAN